MPSRTRQLRKRTGKSGQDSHETKESVELKRRVHKINKAVASEDIAELRRLAVTGPGLINDGLRKLAWPLLLHCNIEKKIERVADKHKQEDQVKLDVDRSFAHLRKGTRKVTLKQNQHELCDIIVQVLRRHPTLHYYQGFHDICSILLLVLGKEAAASAAENIAMFLLRDAMLDSFDVLLSQITLLNTILLQEDKEIYQFLMACDLSPYFCISWVITWCSHDLRSLTKITRLFDFFISSNPLMSVYLAAKIVLNRREELLALECDFAIVHSFLSRLPQNLQVNELIRETQLLYEKYPASKIQKLSDVPLHAFSCVNTYTHQWLSIDPRSIIDYSTADKILSVPTSEIQPVKKLSMYEKFLVKDGGMQIAGGLLVVAFFIAMYYGYGLRR